jgi:hypothetical protein
VVDRHCKDAVFLVIFLIVLAAFVGYGSYAIQIVYTQGFFATDMTSAKLLTLLTLDIVKVSLGYMMGMLGLALCFAIIILVMLRYVTFAAYIVMLVMTFIGLGALIGICFVFNMHALGIVLSVLLVLLFIIWLCYRKELQRIVIVMKTVAIFLSAKPMIFVMTLACQTFCLAVSVFWIAGYYSIITFYNQSAIGDAGFICLTIFWVFCGLYLLFFFFYGMVFLIGGETAIWFYKSKEYSIAAPFKWLIRYHLGSISLAAFLIALVKTAQFLVIMGRTRNSKGIVGFILAVVSCVLRCILVRCEFWTRIINNYAVIVMALTGMSYVDSALTGGCMIFSNPIGYNTFSLISYFIRIAGTFTCVFIPTLISYFLFQLVNLPTSLIAVGMGIVLFFCIMVSIVLLETIVEAMDSMFVFYSLEAQMGEFGERVNEIVDEQEKLEAIYDEGFGGEFVRIKRSVPAQTVEIIANGQRTVVADGKIIIQPLAQINNPNPVRNVPHFEDSLTDLHAKPLGVNEPYSKRV